MILNLDFMEYIKEPVICITDGHEVKYDNGDAAEEFYKKGNSKYAVQNITVKGGIITISIEDKTEEIDAENKKWMEEHKRRTGEDVSFF